VLLEGAGGGLHDENGGRVILEVGILGIAEGWSFQSSKLAAPFCRMVGEILYTWGGPFDRPKTDEGGIAATVGVLAVIRARSNVKHTPRS
jgi:hypothetical protein